MGCMQWHVGIISPMEIVTLALQLPPVIISSAIFDKIRYKYTYITSTRRVHRHLGQNLPQDIVTLAVDTSRYNFQRYIFQNKINIIGHEVNGMYVVTLGYQLAPGNRNVSIRVTSRYNFQRHISKKLMKANLYSVKGTWTWTFGSQVSAGYHNVSCRNTSRYNFQRYIFQNKIIIIGHDVYGMYVVTCGYQISPGYRNVSIRVISRYIFQRHIWQN